jgi:hypothetical protein
MAQLRCPGGLRPGQVGLLVLRRVIMGDIAVTAVDLAQRGFLAAEETSAGWTIRSLPVLNSARVGLLGYERSLLAGLTGQYQAAALTELMPVLGPALTGVRAGLVREAVSRGWIHRWSHRWSHRELTAAGERMAAELSGFERHLRDLKARDGESALATDLLPYALHYQLVSREHLPLARFTAAWAGEFADLPGWRPAAPERQEPGDRGMYSPPIAQGPFL